MKPWKTILSLLLVSLFSACSLITDDDEADSESASGSTLVVGDKLPSFEVTMNDGTKITTADLLGHVSLVMLFSVDCPDCRWQLPEVQRLWDMTSRRQLPIVLISRANSANAIAEYWQQAKLTMTYSPQSDYRVYRLFAENIIPRIYISDAGGTIRYISTDVNMPTAEQLIEKTNAIIEEK
jgi:peroxiredoxin